MISCTLRYEIDPAKVAEFENYARFWVYKVAAMGGVHHGYHLPHEGANDVAFCHFSFDSLAAYEDYRARMWDDEECLRAFAYAESTNCVRRYERSFTRPVMDGASPQEAFG